MEKAGSSSRNPERQVPNKRKRYSSKFLCFCWKGCFDTILPEPKNHEKQKKTR